jgi:hypothetical protein
MKRAKKLEERLAKKAGAAPAAGQPAKKEK